MHVRHAWQGEGVKVAALDKCMKATMGKIQILGGMICRLQTVRGKQDEKRRYDKRYDNDTLLARDNGGLMVISPRYLEWAYALMKKIRASISMGYISAMGNSAQKRAHEFVYADEQLKTMFWECCNKKGSPDDKLVEAVWERVVDFAFHARSEVVWEKYRASRTDRSVGKAKMGLRAFLKAGGSAKKQEKDK